MHPSDKCRRFRICSFPMIVTVPLESPTIKSVEPNLVTSWRNMWQTGPLLVSKMDNSYKHKKQYQPCTLQVCFKVFVMFLFLSYCLHNARRYQYCRKTWLLHQQHTLYHFSSLISTIPCKKSWDTVHFRAFSFSDIFVFLFPSPPFQCCHGRKIYWKILHTQHWKGGGGNRQDSMQFYWKRGIYPTL